MIEHYNALRPLISNWIHGEKYKYENEWNDNPIEVHLSASSLVRKMYTINRIKNLISKHNLNLKVFEMPEMERTDRFCIGKI